MFISVIIPTYNRNDLLIQCLDCLNPQEQPMPAVDYEFIVTDDSKDNIAKQLLQEKYPWVKWVEGAKKGPAANRNNGAKMSKGEWIIFLDDDCLPQAGWLNAYNEAISKYPADQIFEGATDVDRERRRFDEGAPINLDGNKLWSCNFAIRKEVFNEINGFDAGFPFAAMEDVDFYLRITKKAKIIFVPNALVIHPWRIMVAFKNLKKHLYSHKYFLDKHEKGRGYNFRWIRTKIFILSLFKDFAVLASFSMKGWRYYLDISIFNFCMIFI